MVYRMDDHWSILDLIIAVSVSYGQGVGSSGRWPVIWRLWVKYIPEPVREHRYWIKHWIRRKRHRIIYRSMNSNMFSRVKRFQRAPPTTPGNNFHWYQDPSHHTLYTSIDGRTGFYLSKKSNQLFKVFSFFLCVYIFQPDPPWFFAAKTGISNGFHFRFSGFSFKTDPSAFRIQISMLANERMFVYPDCGSDHFYIKGMQEFKLESPPVNTHDLSQVKELLQPNGKHPWCVQDFRCTRKLISNPNERMPYTIWSGTHSNEFQLNRIYNIVTWNGKYFIQRNIQLQSLQFKRRLNDFLGALLNVYVFLLILIVFLSDGSTIPSQDLSVYWAVSWSKSRWGLQPATGMESPGWIGRIDQEL